MKIHEPLRHFLSLFILVVLLFLAAGSGEPNSSTPKTPEEIRKEQIEEHFSPWDGAHRNLVTAVKEEMLDPNSFQHVKTTYWDKGDHLVVNMTFRGTNAFGAVVPHIVKAWIDLDGNIQKWEWL